LAIEAFKRREKKYLITKQQYEALVKQMSPYTRPDRFGQNGMYTVTSLYFDSPDRKIYYETKNKLTFRRKLRLRVYDETFINDTAFFEIKQKHQKSVSKSRVLLPLSEAYLYLGNNTRTPLENYQTSNPSVSRDIHQFLQLYCLRPEMIVSYDRHAFHGLDNPDLRVTFDFNLRCRNDDLFLENGSHGKKLLDSNFIILEVKVNEHIPVWLQQMLDHLQCERKNISKFCTSLDLLRKDELK